ncbi:MAG: hypothetical protein LAO31_15335 [Acidobacteriia bacterium]|nr:hypothetical protein [Terriglobia bacterium]
MNPRKSLFRVAFCTVLIIGLLTVAFGQEPRPPEKSSSSQDSPRIEKSSAPSPSIQSKESEGSSKQKKSSQEKTSNEKARLILDQAYQLSLNAKPATKVEAMTQIAETMAKIDKSKAAAIYRTAFEATQEIPINDKEVNRASLESRLAVGLADIDPEAAMELATRVDPAPPTEESNMMSIFSKGAQNFRAQAIQQVAMKLADKDLSKAMILILPTLRERDFPYDAILPLAGKLKKEAPDKAELLFNELLQQFSVSSPTVTQMIMFSTVIRIFADLNRNLTLQAIDITLQKIPQMEEDLKKAMEKQGGAQFLTDFSFGILVKAVLMPVLRKLDPERAAALEKEVQPAVEKMDKQTGGLFSSALMNSDIDLTDSPEKQEGKILANVDLDKVPEGQRGMLGNSMALNLAQSNPARAQDFTKYISQDKQKAMALAVIAGGFAASDKEKARSVLSEAATLAEKIKAKEDRAVLFTMFAESAVRFDRGLSRGYYGTAFENFDQAFEELKAAVSTEQERTANQNKTQQLSRRYSRAVAGYANVDFDDAVERAKRIADEQEKLLTLVRLATRVLVPDREIPPVQFLGASPRIP